MNASASAINLILISSALYDSLHHNEDALAFIVAHELAHFILGHHQISLENNLKIQQSYMRAARASNVATEQGQLHTINSILGNSGAAFGNALMGLGASMEANNLHKLIDAIYKQERELEFAADNEAVALMLRAGYDVKNAKEALLLGFFL